MKTFEQYINEQLHGLASGKSVQDIADKHGVSLKHIQHQLTLGKEVELEHTKDKSTAEKIAMDHLWENPNYYTKLKRYVEQAEPPPAPEQPPTEQPAPEQPPAEQPAPEPTKKVAIVPGSFRPPHKGHLDMIKKYATKLDEVIVLISTPSAKSQRLTASGNPISPEAVKKVFEIYLQDEGLTNVKVSVSQKPSPITAAYDYIEKDLKDAVVYLGSSKKTNKKGEPDYTRWKTAQKYFKEKNPSIQIIDPAKTAVDVLDGLSASDFRDNINNPKAIAKFIPDSVKEKGHMSKVLSILLLAP